LVKGFFVKNFIIPRSEVLINGIQRLVDEVLSLKGHSFCLKIDKQVDQFLNPNAESSNQEEKKVDLLLPVKEEVSANEAHSIGNPVSSTLYPEVKLQQNNEVAENVETEIEEVDMDIDQSIEEDSPKHSVSEEGLSKIESTEESVKRSESGTDLKTSNTTPPAITDDLSKSTKKTEQCELLKEEEPALEVVNEPQITNDNRTVIKTENVTDDDDNEDLKNAERSVVIKTEDVGGIECISEESSPRYSDQEPGDSGREAKEKIEIEPELINDKFKDTPKQLQKEEKNDIISEELSAENADEILDDKSQIQDMQNINKQIENETADRVDAQQTLLSSSYLHSLQTEPISDDSSNGNSNENSNDSFEPISDADADDDENVDNVSENENEVEAYNDEFENETSRRKSSRKRSVPVKYRGGGSEEEKEDEKTRAKTDSSDSNSRKSNTRSRRVERALRTQRDDFRNASIRDTDSKSKGDGRSSRSRKVESTGAAADDDDKQQRRKKRKRSRSNDNNARRSLRVSSANTTISETRSTRRRVSSSDERSSKRPRRPTKQRNRYSPS